jgi:hypothetical protein
VDPEDLKAYARRAWGAAEALTEEHWAREAAERGPMTAFEASQALWAHMRAIRPDWPTPDDRREDVAHHVALKRLIDRAAGVLAAARR